MEKEKLINPWINLKGYDCFGCSPNNPWGLKMTFYEVDEYIVSEWTPSPHFQGWIDTLHGGIQATLLDEICAWCVFRKLQTTGVTSQMEIRYLKPVLTTEKFLTLKARITEQRRNLVTIEATLSDAESRICTQARCIYYTFSKETAQSEFHFKEFKTESEENKNPMPFTTNNSPIELVFATNNAHKLQEVSSILGNQIKLQSLKDIGCTAELPETSDTFEGNALQKARYIYEHYGLNCFADDSGLEVDALQGAPGVYSARYASLKNPEISAHDDQANTRQLLHDLQGKEERSARFRTVTALILNGESHIFEGTVEGTITSSPVGNGGFGYDPVFIPQGYDQTFAQLSADTKNKISHRANSIAKLKAFLDSIQQGN